MTFLRADRSGYRENISLSILNSIQSDCRSSTQAPFPDSKSSGRSTVGLQRLCLKELSHLLSIRLHWLFGIAHLRLRTPSPTSFPASTPRCKTALAICPSALDHVEMTSTISQMTTLRDTTIQGIVCSHLQETQKGHPKRRHSKTKGTNPLRLADLLMLS